MTLEVNPLEVAAVVGAAMGLLLSLLGALVWSARGLQTSTRANSSLVATLLKLNDELQSTSDERRQYEAARAQWESERRALARQVAEQEGQIAAARAADAQHTALLIGVKEELAEGIRCQGELEERVESLEAAIRLKEREIGELRAALSEKDQRIAHLEDKVRRLERERSDLEVERKALMAQVQGLREERDELNARIGAMQGELEALARRGTGPLAPEGAAKTEAGGETHE